jgi:hypothetical protein
VPCVCQKEEEGKRRWRGVTAILKFNDQDMGAAAVSTATSGDAKIEIEKSTFNSEDEGGPHPLPPYFKNNYQRQGRGARRATTA